LEKLKGTKETAVSSMAARSEHGMRNAVEQPRASKKVMLQKSSEAAERRRSGWNCWPVSGRQF